MTAEAAPGGRPAASARPRLARGVRLRVDAVRGETLLVAPERAALLDPVAAAVLTRCDGRSDLAAIAAGLAAETGAPQAIVEREAGELLAALAARGFVRLA